MISTNTADINSLGGRLTNTESDVSSLSQKVENIELFKFPNVIIYGEPTINNGQISNFSSNNYLSLPFVFDIGEKSFEWNLSFTTSGNVTQAQNIIGSRFCMALFIENGQLKFRVSNNGSNWNVADITTSIQIQPSTTYYLKIKFDRLSYTIKSSTNGKDYTQIGYKVTTLPPIAGQLYFGIGNNKFNPFTGFINLNRFELLENNIVVWEGMDDVGLASRLATDLENIDDIGIDNLKEIVGTEFAKIEDIPNLNYKVGDTYSLTNFITMSNITNNSKDIQVSFVLPKNIPNSLNANINITKWSVINDGNYLISNDTIFDNDKFSISVVTKEENYLTVKISTSENSNWEHTPKNNDICSLFLYGTITFS